MNIILYTTHCPKCKVLQKKLNQNNISYIINQDIDKMLQLGILSAPALEIDNIILDFGQAIKWLKENYN